MTLAGLFRTLADIVLIAHVAFVAFVVLGLLLILYGGCRNWRWIRNPWFRVLHLVAIGLVVIQSWLGIICPLTTLEVALRERAGQVTYERWGTARLGRPRSRPASGTFQGPFSTNRTCRQFDRGGVP